MSGPFQLDGQVALVTGGGTGIGLGIASCLAAMGARVAVAGRREERLREAVAQIGERAIAISADVTDLDSLPGHVRAVEDELGPLSILVNNAGNYANRPSLEQGDEEFASVIATHLSGAFALSREVARGMVDRGSGSIVFVSSLNALIGMPNVAAYSAAKAGLGGLVSQLAVEWAPFGVRVNAVIPGWIDTGIAKRAFGQDAARRERAMGRTPIGHFGTPEDVGWATAYLCSPAAGFVTGSTLRVDGGAVIAF